MSHVNNLISFLRHYGPIPASDNMYDEGIQTGIEQYGIIPLIKIPPARFGEVEKNFESSSPRNIILTGTAGDGKTYHCRLVWDRFGGSEEKWQQGDKVVSLPLKTSGKNLTIVKDLSELKEEDKSALLPDLEQALFDRNGNSVFLVAANDGQLLATWGDWAEENGNCRSRKIFKTVELMLVEGYESDPAGEFNLDLYNLSQLDAAEHFEKLVEQIVEHPQWGQCRGCELLSADGATDCPIRINRERLRGSSENSTFRKRLGDLLRLARANSMHLPIRDLLLLIVNIVLGDHDQKSGRILLDCRTAKERAEKKEYRLTNPYANVFGLNLPERRRQQYQIFMTLDAFGIGRETNNKFDNLLIYEQYKENSALYRSLVENDPQYGAFSYRPFLQNYIEGNREDIKDFMHSLACQRQRLFFSIPQDSDLRPWMLTVYKSSRKFLEFIDGIKDGANVSRTEEELVRGLNRTFCGMMIDDCSKLYLTSSGGDGRGRIASLLNYDLSVGKDHRNSYIPYVCFKVDDCSILSLQIFNPAKSKSDFIEKLDLPPTHFEYLIRVANGSLPASFSRQCHEDFLDFKLRVIKKLGIPERDSSEEFSMQYLTVDERGRAQIDEIRIDTGARGK